MLKIFLSQLGKPHEIAAAIQALSGERCSVGSVYQWPYENKIPLRWRYYVAKLAKKKRVPKDSVPPEIQGYMQ